ncbi:MAG: hypothetical protein QOH88_1230 [Verrucomicrobiota bacterium]
MPASLESPAGTAPSVLLIEEYDALASAITSALKKFAPRHRTRVVQSISDAEAGAREAQPQLFVIDFDPPQANAIEFLQRMSVAHPEARVLAIASGISPDLASERYGKNAIQFIEKPFELADFGAAVQALLGPWTETRSGDSRGTLRDLNLRDFIPLEGVSGANAILEIEAEGALKGELHFSEGQICHANASGLSGTSALQEMMRWEHPRGKETERDADGPRTIKGSWQHSFREALHATKPRRTEDRPVPPLPPAIVPAPAPPSENGKPEKSAARTGKRIVVIDDTEMLLIFVEDVLSTADPSLQIVTTFTGGEGVRRAEVMIPDLVLLDYSLPDLRGDQVCERLLKNEATARIPIVMMSGHVAEMAATAERYRNVVATIAKPFMSEALVALVRETLANGPLAPEISPKNKPAVAVEEPRPVRYGNGKKPVKKNGAGKQPEPQIVSRPPAAPAAPPTPAVEVKEPVAAAAPPIPAPPPPAAPSIEIKEPVALPAPAQVSSISVAREIRPAEPALLEHPQVLFRPSPAAQVASSNGGPVLLGLGMEVISVQFTPRFQVGTIRAKPSATTLSLTQFLGASGAESFWGPGFELGAVELDAHGQIRTMRVTPTRRPADSIRPHNGFNINQVKLVNDQACIQLISGTAAPMTMQLVAMFRVAAVELSDRFEVAQLVLQPEGSRVRITLDPQTRGAAATEFDTVRVHLDSSSRIAELVLNSTAAAAAA